MIGPVSYKVMLGDGRVVRRHVDQIHTHHQRPEKFGEHQQPTSTQLCHTKKEVWLEAEEVVLSDDKLEEPAATEAVGSLETEQRTVANATPVRRNSQVK